MMKLRTIAIGLLLALASPLAAFAQCSGQAPALTYCGNPTGALALPGWKPFSGIPFPNIAGGTVVGNRGTSTAAASAITNPILGIPGTSSGEIGLAGATSGTVTIKPQAAAGTYNFNLPTSAGTSGQPLLSGGGGASAQTYGTVAAIFGGTGFTSYTLGDLLYANSGTTLTKLAGNITTGKQYLSQTGTGVVSAAPAWSTIDGGDITGAALTKVDDTNVTLTLGGTPATALLRAASLTLGWTGQLGLSRGGTAASLTASNGGIVYSTASALAILSGTATANQLLMSGSSAAPAWSTATYPATAAAGTVLAAASANTVAATPTPVLGANGGTGGQITFNGSTSGSAAVRVAAAAGTSTIFQLPSSNGTNLFYLQTDGSGNTSWVGAVNSIAGNTGAFTLSTGLTSSTNAILIDKATSSNLEAGTSNKVLTSDIIYDSAVNLGTTVSGSVTWDFNTFLNATTTLTGNVTSLTCSNIKASQSGVIQITQGGGGSNTMVAGWCSQFRWQTGVRGVLTTTASAIDALFYQCISTSVCFVSLSKAQAN